MNVKNLDLKKCNMSRLDVNSSKGQESLRLEEDMLDHIYQTINRKLKIDVLDIIQTPKQAPAVCDGVLSMHTDRDILVGIFESKCRNISLDQLKGYGTALITYRKIEECQQLSKALCVPFYIFLYTSDKEILIWKVTDSTGKRLFSFDVQKTKTQRTINGGVAYRSNAFLPVKEAVLLVDFKI